MATSIHPLVAQARAALAAGALQPAVDFLQRRLADEPRDINARLTLADVQLAAGHADDALASVRTAIRDAPRHPLIHVKFGHMLVREARWADALDAADRALKLDPTCTPALALKSTIFERQDKYPRAERLLAPELRADRPHPDIGPTAMRVLLHAGRTEEAIEFAARYEAAHPAASRTLRDVRFELARAHERRGDIDAAVATARVANDTAAAPFDREIEAARFDAIIRATSAAAMDAIPRAPQTGDEPPVVFIVGMPRAGATLIERTLHAHPDATGIGEDPAIHHAAYALHRRGEGWGLYPECLARLTADVVAEVRAETLADLRRRGGRGRVIVSKGLGNAMHLGLISRLFPEARVIHARRDPVDTCLSCWMEPLGGGGTAWASRLEDAGWHHRRLDSMLDHWRTVAGLPILDVHYESFVRDQPAVVRAILEHAGLDWHEGCLDFHRVKRIEQTLSFDQVRRPLYDSSVGRADRFGDHLDGLRAALAGAGAEDAHATDPGAG